MRFRGYSDVNVAGENTKWLRVYHYSRNGGHVLMVTNEGIHGPVQARLSLRDFRGGDFVRYDPLENKAVRDTTKREIAIDLPVYGSEMPINQVATVSTPDNQTLSVTVWDITNAPAVEKAIRDSGLGLNPMTAGGVIRLNMPPLTEERRRELTKVAGKYAEEAKISMRNIRQDAMGKIKRAVTDKEISEDDQRKFEDDLQKVFDKRGTEVDALAREKEADIMSV